MEAVTRITPAVVVSGQPEGSNSRHTSLTYAGDNKSADVLLL